MRQMMYDDSKGRLTLAQVEEIGVFAWHDDGIVFAYGQTFALEIQLSITSLMSRSPRVEDDIRLVGASVFQPRTINSQYDGWHHLEGCECKYCHPDLHPQGDGA
jgi:hypothetical protein